MNPTLTHERVREALHYDPETGVFTWLIKPARSKIEVGDVAGSRQGLYRQVKLDGHNYREHQLIWFWVTSTWPEHEIDHVNGIKSDNRLVNLRDEPRSTNQHNVVEPRQDNTSGLRGVTRDKGRWKAQIKVNGKQHHLGCFDTPEEASAAYWVAKAEHHGAETYQVRFDREVG